MKNLLGIGALAAAALVAEAASAEPITVGKSNLVIDVEFWGRQLLRAPDPDDFNNDIITYGDPIEGSFRIWTDDIPAKTHRTLLFPTDPNAVRYAGDPGQEFVMTTGWIFPAPGLASDDSLTIGDNLPFYPDQPRRDWFEVSDAFTDTFPFTSDRRELTVSVTTPLDIIQGTGLDQEFDLVSPDESGGRGIGFLRTRIDGVVRLMEFVVDRLRVSNELVCRP